MKKCIRISIPAIVVVIIILFANFYALLPSVTYTIFPVIILCMSFLVCYNNRSRTICIPKRWGIADTLWILLCLLAIVGNQSLARGDYVSTLRLVSLIIFCIFASTLQLKKISNIYKWIIAIGFINVLATFFFYLVPSAYRIIINFYGYVPTGTGTNGEYGYRAGIADHYSQNGVYIAIPFIICTILYFWNRKNKHVGKQRNIYLILSIISGIALLMTTKRGPLLFACMAIVVIYYLFNRDKVFSTTFKVIIVVLLISIFIYFFGSAIPILSDIIARFETSGTDSETLTRFRMWTLAITKFKENPILGIGWFGFRYEHATEIYNAAINDSRYMYLHAHNVYIQMLCERGIIGFVVYVSLLLINLHRGFRLVSWLSETAEDNITRSVISGLAIQVFYVLYSFTGNCLYDMMFLFYIIGVVMVNTGYVSYRNEMEKGALIKWEK